MNADELKQKWEQFKERLREKWSKLNDDDWQQVAGDQEKLIEKIKSKYGISREEAEKELRELLNKDNDQY